MQTTLIVLAAGMGSRYGGLKQMDPMGPSGETVLDYSVFDAIRAGFDKVIFIIRTDFEEQFRKQVVSKFKNKIQVELVFQTLDDLPKGFTVPEGRVKPWGTTHAILAARHSVNEPFAIINADDFYGRDGLQQVADALKISYENGVRDQYAIVGYKLGNTLSAHGSVNRGVCSYADGLLKSVEEFTEIEENSDGICSGINMKGVRQPIALDTLVSMNLWGFSPSVMGRLEQHFIKFLQEHSTELKSECYIPTVVDELIQNGIADCHVVSSDSQWFGVTYPDDKAQVVESIEKLVAMGEYPKSLW